MKVLFPATNDSITVDDYCTHIVSVSVSKNNKIDILKPPVDNEKFDDFVQEKHLAMLQDETIKMTQYESDGKTVRKIIKMRSNRLTIGN